MHLLANRLNEVNRKSFDGCDSRKQVEKDRWSLPNIGMGGNRVEVVKQDWIHGEDWGPAVNLRMACENVKQKCVLMTWLTTLLIT